MTRQSRLLFDESEKEMLLRDGILLAVEYDHSSVGCKIGRIGKTEEGYVLYDFHDETTDIYDDEIDLLKKYCTKIP